ncbi:MAG TPA: DUF5989 family protein [Myxococcota bacterium]|nr:DUF5989 family protein [Myxococcota bacterium]
MDPTSAPPGARPSGDRPTPGDRAADFRARASAPRRSLAREVLSWLARTRKWWLLPLVLTPALLGFFLVLAASGAGPLLYTLF